MTEVTEEIPTVEDDFNFYLFLDIDEVLCPSGALFNRSTAWPDFRWVDTRTRSHVYSPSMVEALNDFIREYKPTVVTVSMHEDRARYLCNLLGLENSYSWPWLKVRRSNSGVWTKFESIRDKATTEGAVVPSIWIDDDLANEHEASLWAAENGVLALSTSMSHGITRAHLVHMKNYAEGVREKKNLERLLEVVTEDSASIASPDPDSPASKAANFYKSFEDIDSSLRDTTSERYV